jgi:RNA polymerase sigma factor (sigma-70 family)
MIPSDRQLIARFLQHREQFALDQLICRHSEMVMKVCRKMLEQSHDADDAFQATFLVFARKIRTVQDRSSVAGWLYEVAIRNCLQIRQRRHRKRETEIDQDCPLNQSLDGNEPWQILSQSQETEILFREIERLPAKYREVIVLRCIDEHSRRDTANMLNRTEFAVKGLLARGRSLLKHRLVKRGITSSIVIAAMKPGHCFGSAATVSSKILDSTIKACLRPSLGSKASASMDLTASQSLDSATTAPTKLAYFVAAASTRQLTIAALSRVGSLAAALLVLIAVPLGVVAQQSLLMDGQVFESQFSNSTDQNVEVLAIVSDDEQSALKVWNLANANPTEKHFGKLANQYSVDPVSKFNFGEVTPIIQGAIHQNLEEEALRLGDGEISNVVQVGEKWVTMFRRGRSKTQDTSTPISNFANSNTQPINSQTQQDDSATDEQLERIKKKLESLNGEFDLLVERVGAGHPSAIELKKQIEAWNRFINESETHIEARQPNQTPRQRTADEERQLEAVSKIKPKFVDAEYSSAEIDSLMRLRTFSKAGKHGFEIFRQSELNQRTVLRVFLDSNADRKLDQWIYFKDGIETYRDVDSDFDGKTDYCIVTKDGESRRGISNDVEAMPKTLALVSQLRQELEEQVKKYAMEHEGNKKLLAKGYLTQKALDESKLKLDSTKESLKNVSSVLAQTQKNAFSGWESVDSPPEYHPTNPKGFFDYDNQFQQRLR